MFGLSPLPRHVDAALRDVAHRSVEVRLSALRDLGRHADDPRRPEVIAAVVATLRGDDSERVRRAAALTLADLEAVEALPSLVAAARDDLSPVQQFAVVALSELAPEGSADVMEVAAEALESELPALRYQALPLWARVAGERRWPRLLSATTDADPEVRSMALRVLSRTPDGPSPPASVAERALAATADPDPRVRLQAALLLGRLGDRRGEPALLEAVAAARFPGDEADEVDALEVVGTARLERARAALHGRLRGLRSLRATALVQHAAVVALLRLGDDWAVGLVRRRLRSLWRAVRADAITAVARARAVALREDLRAVAEASDALVRELAIDALRQLGPSD